MENTINSGSVIPQHQKLMLDNLILSKNDYSKIKEQTRYELSGLYLMDVGDNVISCVNILLGNIEFDRINGIREYESNNVVIEKLETTMYPGQYNYKEID